MQQIPINPVASQALSIVLDGQAFGIVLRTSNLTQTKQTKSESGQIITSTYNTPVMLANVSLNGDVLVNAVACRDFTPLIATPRYGVQGNLYFIDTQGTSDPVYTGLGARYQLLYLTQAEYDLIRKY